MIETILKLVDEVIEAVKKTLGSLEELKTTLIAHPQTDGSASDAIAKEVEEYLSRTTATTVKVPLLDKGSKP